LRIISIHSEFGLNMQIDENILKDCIKQNCKAQKDLYAYCFSLFMPLCCRYHSNEEDARFSFNSGFIKVINGLENVDLKKINFIPWSKRIFTNVLIDEYRKNKNHQAHYLTKETERELENSASLVQNDAESDFGYQQILNLIEQIPQTHALVFKLYVIEGFSHKEISDQLSMNIGTCKWHLSTARKLLKEKLEKMEQQASKKMAI
jgi:RNA polymerase sigma factor (sigma-70 family)